MQLRPHHIALSISTLKRSINFYNQLGFEQVMHWQAEDQSLQIVHLRNTSLILELFCYAQPQTAPTSSQTLAGDLQRIGCKHFGLQSDDLEASLLKLKTKGLAQDIQITQGRTGTRYFFLQDPDGIFVEIIEDKRKFPT